MAVERRLDPNDGCPYSRAEFYTEYGGLTEWVSAQPAPDAPGVALRGEVSGAEEQAKRSVAELNPGQRQKGVEMAGGRQAWMALSWVERLEVARKAGLVMSVAEAGVSEERRIDDEDGKPYTQAEFLECYGSECAVRWARARPVDGAPPRVIAFPVGPLPPAGPVAPYEAPFGAPRKQHLSKRAQQRYTEFQTPEAKGSGGGGGGGKGNRPPRQEPRKQGEVVVRVVLFSDGFRVDLPDAMELGAYLKEIRGVKMGCGALLPFSKLLQYGDVRFRRFVEQLREVAVPEELQEMAAALSPGGHLHLDIVDRDDTGALWQQHRGMQQYRAAPDSRLAAASAPAAAAAPGDRGRLEGDVAVAADGRRFETLSTAGTELLVLQWQGRLSRADTVRIADWEKRVRMALDLCRLRRTGGTAAARAAGLDRRHSCRRRPVSTGVHAPRARIVVCGWHLVRRRRSSRCETLRHDVPLASA